jgi:hypothetical protein
MFGVPFVGLSIESVSYIFTYLAELIYSSDGIAYFT